jgi:hypothetical protein
MRNQAALQVAEKVLSFVGRAFRHDIKSMFSWGVLTPEGLNAHFPAACLAAGLMETWPRHKQFGFFE